MFDGAGLLTIAVDFFRHRHDHQVTQRTISPSWRPAGVRPRGHHIEAVSKVLHVAEIEAVGRRSLPDRQADVC